MADLSTYHLFNSVKQEVVSDLDESEAAESKSSVALNGFEQQSSDPWATAKDNSPSSSGLLIPFDDAQAAVTSYPPGCSVLHMSSSADLPVITMGTIDSVSFNVTSQELVYRLKPKERGDFILASEQHLQFAPRCKVFAEVTDDTGTSKIEAIVLSSYQPDSESTPLYSLREDGPSGALFHGVPKTSIKFRPATAAVAISPLSASYNESSLDPTASIWTSPKHDDGQDTETGWSQPTSSTMWSENKYQLSPLNDNNNELPSPSATHNSYDEETKWDELMKLQQKFSYDSQSPQVSPSHSSLHSSHHGDGLIETKFVVPGCAFTVDAIKAFMYDSEVVNNIIRDTQCQINLKFYKGDGLYRKRAIYFELKGTRDNAMNAIHELESSLIDTLDRQEKGHTLYYMALLNGHRQKSTSNKVVRQFCYHFDKKGMWFMYARRLPKEPRITALLIGKGGSNHKKLMRETNCHIEINASSSRDPHYVIYGQTESLVLECMSRLENCLAGAQAFLRDSK